MGVKIQESTYLADFEVVVVIKVDMLLGAMRELIRVCKGVYRYVSFLLLCKYWLDRLIDKSE